MPRKTEKSRELQKRAEQLIPGGVNSPVRAFGAVGGDPVFIVRGQGSQIWDADGNEYIDYLGSWGPLILGHAAPGSGGSRYRRGAQWHELRRIHPRRSRSRRTGSRRLSPHAEGPLREFRDGSDHVGHPPGSRLYQAQICCEIRGLLSRPCRCAAGESRIRRCHAGYSGFGRRARGVHPVHDRPALQRRGCGRTGLRQVPAPDCLRDRRTRGGQYGLRPGLRADT